MNTLTINRLPSRTWNFLRVNETALQLGRSADRRPRRGDALSLRHAGARPHPRRGRGRIQPQENRRRGAVRQPPDVFETFMAEENIAVETELTVRAGATVRLVQVQRTKPGSVLYSKITGTCAESGRIELVQVFPGSGDVYADTLIDLPRTAAAFRPTSAISASAARRST